ncbi:DNA internalization-related competence protein ComEC/Rec2 [Castellaniella sp.]|uniref:DNA internalization-related competence protein ComEC/Rec2 n=1 Tax=Castellaniella sp. TaxID=1955812 RepID=UPI0035607AB4
MVGRLAVMAGLLGVIAVHEMASLAPRPALGAALVAVLAVQVLAWWGARAWPMVWSGTLWPEMWPGLSRLGWCLLAAWSGFALTTVWAQARLGQALADGNVDRVSRVELRVASLPRLQPDRIGFDADVLHAHPAGVPQRIRVNWAATGWRSPHAAPRAADPPFPEVRPGQVWRMALVLRPIFSAHNPGGFDYEGHVFTQGLRAVGTVRGTPLHLRDDDWHSLSIVAERARHAVRKAMAPWLVERRYGPVLRALAIGDQDGVDDADWQVFNRSGLTHLVSISGSHITMLSGAAALFVSALWRRARWRGRCLAEHWPARRAAACAALLVAWLYCLLAGWGVPAQRTFLMLAVVAGAQALQLRLSPSRVLALAAVLVVAFDPWSIRASGFWLSFMAVAILFAVGAASQQALHEGDSASAGPGNRADASWQRTVRLAVKLQLAVTFALAPALAWLFHEISVVSPLANAYAIPLIELVVTPLSLLLAAVALLPGADWAAQGLAWLAHAVLQAMMWPTEWLAALPTWPVPAGPAWIYLVALCGAGLALYPKPVVAGQRYWPWLAFLPMLLWTPPRPGSGEWDLLALDVGQGSAVLIQTARHTLLFDAGARHARDSEEGSRTVLPALRALGITRLDALIVSHADLDHAGGVSGVLQGIPVEQSFASFDLQNWLQAEARKLQAGVPPGPLAMVPCLFGSHWVVDGVAFEFLWPLDQRAVRKGNAANEGSCVLRVRGARHGALLTGDIERQAEAALVHRGLGASDVVVAAHHGSRTSSTAAFVEASVPGHVLIQAGRWNRHGHPDRAVVRRWQRAGARIWRTDRQGAIMAHSRMRGLSVYSVLESSRRYWHGRRG